MDTQPPQPGHRRSKSNRLAGASSYTSIIGTQPECRHQFVHCNAANAATKIMTQDAQWKIICKTESSTNKKKKYAVECENIQMVVNGHQLTK